MEGSLSSERVTAPRSDDDRDSVRDGVKVDDEQGYKPVRDGTQGRKQIRTRTSTFRIPRSLFPADNCDFRSWETLRGA